ncbi:MAG: hypothetical protein QXO47_10885 [Thermoproteota archaeon]
MPTVVKDITVKDVKRRIVYSFMYLSDDSVEFGVKKYSYGMASSKTAYYWLGDSKLRYSFEHCDEEGITREVMRCEIPLDGQKQSELLEEAKSIVKLSDEQRDVDRRVKNLAYRLEDTLVNYVLVW